MALDRIVTVRYLAPGGPWQGQALAAGAITDHLLWGVYSIGGAGRNWGPWVVNPNTHTPERTAPSTFHLSRAALRLDVGSFVPFGWPVAVVNPDRTVHLGYQTRRGDNDDDMMEVELRVAPDVTADRIARAADTPEGSEIIPYARGAAVRASVSAWAEIEDAGGATEPVQVGTQTVNVPVVGRAFTIRPDPVIGEYAELEIIDADGHLWHVVGVDDVERGRLVRLIAQRVL